MGWRWSRGSNLVTGPLGSVAGEPDRRQRQLLCLLPVQAAGAWQVRRCVCSAHRPSASTQVQDPAIGRRPVPEKRIPANSDDDSFSSTESIDCRDGGGDCSPHVQERLHPFNVPGRDKPVQLRKKAVRSAIAGATGSEAEQHEYLLKELMPLIEEKLAGGAPKKKRNTAYLDTPVLVSPSRKTGHPVYGRTKPRLPRQR